MTVSWGFRFSSSCPSIVDHGFVCQVCGNAAAGHCTVDHGPHDGRCLAVLCVRHASDVGWNEFRERMIEWSLADLVDLATGGPGKDGAPEVWHVDHLDPLPTADHGAGW